MSMIDLGTKPSSVETQTAPLSKEKYYPSVYIDVPGTISINEDSIGNDISIKAIIRIKRLSVHESKEKNKDQKNSSLELEIRKIDFGSSQRDKTIQEVIEEGLSESEKK